MGEYMEIILLLLRGAENSRYIADIDTSKKRGGALFSSVIPSKKGEDKI
jgi:hypothetical protein